MAPPALVAAAPLLEYWETVENDLCHWALVTTGDLNVPSFTLAQTYLLQPLGE